MKKIFLVTMLLASLLSGCDEVLAQDIFVPTTVLDLDDTPDDYTGHGGDCVAVKVAEDGIEFVACAASGGGSSLVFRVDAVTLSVATGTLDFDGTDFTVTESPANYFDIAISAERISDLTGAMVTGNTETGITVTYQDADNTIDFDVALGTSISAAEIADGDHGDFTYTSGVAAIDANAIALGTDTTGGYAASTTEGGGATSLEADGLDALTEIAQSIKTAANDTSALVVGTAGATNELAKWDANGNLVDHNVIIGTLTDGKWCSYASSGTVLSCTQDAPAGSGDMTAMGNCTSGDAFTGGCGTTLAANTDLIMDLDEDNNGTETFQIRNGADSIVVEVDELGGLTANQINLGSDEVIQFPSGSITETGSDIQFSGADVEIIDDLDLIFGTNEDWKIQYDEGVDNQLLFITANTSAIATTDPMVEFLVGATPTADQEVFGVSKGTQATNTALMALDEDGDVVFLGDLTVTGDDITMATNTSGAVLVADGTNFNPVVMSGDATISTSGVVDVIDSSTTQAGEVEIAIDTEINTGTDAGRAISPDSLAGSNFGKRVLQLPVFDWTTDTATGDGKFYAYIPVELNGMNLIAVHAQVITVGTTNTLNVDLARCATVATGNVCSGTVSDMLSTNLTVDSNEDDSSTAAAAAAIDGANDDVATGQVIRVDVDAVHTTAAKGLIITLEFQLP